MLNKLLKKYVDDIPSLDGGLIDADYLEMSDVNMDEPKLFLYQSGYLTIKVVKGDCYLLGYPNREVKKAMYEMVLPMMTDKPSSEVTTLVQKLKMNLSMGNVDDAMLCLKGLVAGTPYSIQKKEQFVFEEHFRFILKNIFYLCGFETKEEIEMASGRIDLIAQNDSYVYVMELKMDDNGGINAAISQMKSRHYADIYAASEKKIICLALEFSKESRGLKEWQVLD